MLGNSQGKTAASRIRERRELNAKGAKVFAGGRKGVDSLRPPAFKFFRSCKRKGTEDQLSFDPQSLFVRYLSSPCLLHRDVLGCDGHVSGETPDRPDVVPVGA